MAVVAAAISPLQQLKVHEGAWDAAQDELLLEALKATQARLLQRADGVERRLNDSRRRAEELSARLHGAAARLEALAHRQFVERCVDGQGEAGELDTGVCESLASYGSDLQLKQQALSVAQQQLDVPVEAAWRPLPPLVGSPDFWQTLSPPTTASAEPAALATASVAGSISEDLLAASGTREVLGSVPSWQSASAAGLQSQGSPGPVPANAQMPLAEPQQQVLAQVQAEHGDGEGDREAEAEEETLRPDERGGGPVDHMSALKMALASRFRGSQQQEGPDDAEGGTGAEGTTSTLPSPPLLATAKTKAKAKPKAKAPQAESPLAGPPDPAPAPAPVPAASLFKAPLLPPPSKAGKAPPRATSLFGDADEDDHDAAPPAASHGQSQSQSQPSKGKGKAPSRAKSLFDDDDNEDALPVPALGKAGRGKAQAQVQAPPPAPAPTPAPLQTPSTITTKASKAPSRVSSLFDDDDDDAPPAFPRLSTVPDRPPPPSKAAAPQPAPASRPTPAPAPSQSSAVEPRLPAGSALFDSASASKSAPSVPPPLTSKKSSMTASLFGDADPLKNAALFGDEAPTAAPGKPKAKSGAASAASLFGDDDGGPFAARRSGTTSASLFGDSPAPAKPVRKETRFDLPASEDDVPPPRAGTTSSPSRAEVPAAVTSPAPKAEPPLPLPKAEVPVLAPPPRQAENPASPTKGDDQATAQKLRALAERSAANTSPMLGDGSGAKQMQGPPPGASQRGLRSSLFDDETVQVASTLDPLSQLLSGGPKAAAPAAKAQPTDPLVDLLNKSPADQQPSQLPSLPEREVRPKDPLMGSLKKDPAPEQSPQLPALPELEEARQPSQLPSLPAREAPRPAQPPPTGVRGPLGDPLGDPLGRGPEPRDAGGRLGEPVPMLPSNGGLAPGVPPGGPIGERAFQRDANQEARLADPLGGSARAEPQKQLPQLPPASPPSGERQEPSNVPARRAPLGGLFGEEDEEETLPASSFTGRPSASSLFGKERPSLFGGDGSQGNSANRLLQSLFDDEPPPSKAKVSQTAPVAPSLTTPPAAADPLAAPPAAPAQPPRLSSSQGQAPPPRSSASGGRLSGLFGDEEEESSSGGLFGESRGSPPAATGAGAPAAPTPQPLPQLPSEPPAPSLPPQQPEAPSLPHAPTLAPSPAPAPALPSPPAPAPAPAKEEIKEQDAGASAMKPPTRSAVGGGGGGGRLSHLFGEEEDDDDGGLFGTRPGAQARAPSQGRARDSLFGDEPPANLSTGSGAATGSAAKQSLFGGKVGPQPAMAGLTSSVANANLSANASQSALFEAGRMQPQPTAQRRLRSTEARKEVQAAAEAIPSEELGTAVVAVAPAAAGLEAEPATLAASVDPSHVPVPLEAESTSETEVRTAQVEAAEQPEAEVEATAEVGIASPLPAQSPSPVPSPFQDPLADRVGTQAAAEAAVEPIESALSQPQPWDPPAEAAPAQSDNAEVPPRLSGDAVLMGTSVGRLAAIQQRLAATEDSDSDSDVDDWDAGPRRSIPTRPASSLAAGLLGGGGGLSSLGPSSLSGGPLGGPTTVPASSQPSGLFGGTAAPPLNNPLQSSASSPPAAEEESKQAAPSAALPMDPLGALSRPRTSRG